MYLLSMGGNVNMGEEEKKQISLEWLVDSVVGPLIESAWYQFPVNT